MASHTRAELRGAATALGRAALRAGFRPGAGLPVAATHGLARAVFDGSAPRPRNAPRSAVPPVTAGGPLVQDRRGDLGPPVHS